MSVIMMCEMSHATLGHATFNAAFLTALSQAFPTATIRFLSTKAHFDAVQAAWQLAQEARPSGVVWVDINADDASNEVGPPPDTFKRGVRSRVLKALLRERPHMLVYESVHPTFIGIIKLLSRARIIPTRLVMIWHAQLAWVTGDNPRTRKDYQALDRAVRQLNSSNTFQLVLSPSIQRSLAHRDPAMAGLVRSIHLPCLWKVPPIPDEHLPTRPVRFGHLGVISEVKRFEKFVEIAQRVRADFPEAEFVSIGTLLDPSDKTRYTGTVEVSELPISLDAYASRAQAITYSVITSSPSYYEMVASLSFLDSLCYGKPGIYLRNPFIEYCFHVMGDIGYLCESYEEMGEIMAEILRDFPHARYRQQRQNIFAHRDIFHAASVGRELRTLLDRVTFVP